MKGLESIELAFTWEDGTVHKATVTPEDGYQQWGAGIEYLARTVDLLTEIGYAIAEDNM